MVAILEAVRLIQPPCNVFISKVDHFEFDDKIVTINESLFVIKDIGVGREESSVLEKVPLHLTIPTLLSL